MSACQPKPSKLLQGTLSPFVKSTNIPSDPISQLGYNLSEPLIYVLPFDSQSDLIALRKSCIKLDLPDPFSPLTIGDTTFSRCFFTSTPKSLFSKKKKNHIQLYIDEFYQLLELHKKDSTLNVQILPVCIVWDRTPGTEIEPAKGLKPQNTMEKAGTIFVHGRNSIVRYSSMLPMRKIIDELKIDETTAFKLAKVANIQFSRQCKAASGPDLPHRQTMLTRLLNSDTIEQAVQNDAEHRKIPAEKVRREANNMMEEIAANFSPTLFRIGEGILSWVWSKLYQGLTISNAEQVRKLAQSNAEILYLPCHRSHMDYLLLSYVLYTEGLVPPHAAAGINLNFFPAGPIFRRGGAFFIRRSFRGNVLYSTVFREYLAELFDKGYPMEFFLEGGRSRTGRLRKPKTGMLAMTVEAMLKSHKRNLFIVPVYIGYEHIMEVNTYTKELQGMNKKSESLGQVFGILGKLRNYGEGFVNFGDPINVNQFLTSKNPMWNKSKPTTQTPAPEWLRPAVFELADIVMTKINDACAANGLTLCATALLASNQRALTREALEEQLDIYLSLLREIPYSSSCTVSKLDAKQLVNHVMNLDKFIVERDSLGEMITLDSNLTILMTYYRNNIIHILAIPSLIALIFVYQRHTTAEKIKETVALLYPFLKTELFMNLTEESLDSYIDALLTQLQQLKLIEGKEGRLYRNPARLRQLQLLGNTITETIQRYALTLTLLRNDPEASHGELDQQSQMMAQRLSRLHNINAPEFSDKETFTSMMNTLHLEGYVNESHAISSEMETLYNCIFELIPPDVQLTIEAISHRS